MLRSVGLAGCFLCVSVSIVFILGLSSVALRSL